MLGRLEYTYGDIVQFKVGNEIKPSIVEIIDAYGTFSQSEKPYYDVMVQTENCLYTTTIKTQGDK